MDKIFTDIQKIILRSPDEVADEGGQKQNMTAKKFAALIFSIAFFCLSAAYGLPAQAGAAASSQWCHDQAIALQKTCTKTSQPLICSMTLNSFVSSCDKAFAPTPPGVNAKALALQKMTAAKLKSTMDAEAAKFSVKAPYNGALINPDTAKPYTCQKNYITTNCLTKLDCEKNFITETIGDAKVPNIVGIWDAKTQKCNLPLGTCFVDAQCPSTQYCGNGSGKTQQNPFGNIEDIIEKILPKAQWGNQTAVDKAYATSLYKCYNKKFGGMACNTLFFEQCLSKSCECPDNTCFQTKCSCKKDTHCEVGYVCNLNGGICKKAICGDWVFDGLPYEECDQGKDIKDGPCTPTCKKAICGDKITQPNDPTYEECDDGNGNNLDQCTNKCISAICGDGLVQPTNGEQCDDGNKENGDGCSAECKIECGNGKINGTEPCDDGNLINTDACTNMCTTAFCGDGYWQPVGSNEKEECDDGNDIDTDECSNKCTLKKADELPLDKKTTVTLKTGFGEVDGEYCCNGQLYCLPPASEKIFKESYVAKALQCLNQHGCIKGTCGTIGKCGNGKKDTPLEECDDGYETNKLGNGNGVNNDGCSTTCKIEKELTATEYPDNNIKYYCKGTPVSCIEKAADEGIADDIAIPACLKKYNCVDSACGNSKPEGSEECDDGNKKDIDDCTNACKKAACGDTIIQTEATVPETCEDGNQIDDDACTNKCVMATCGDWVVRKDKGNEEACDDGNKVAGDGCSDLCKNEKGPPKCGNGGKPDTKAGEECDDGNKASGDGCSSICKLEKGPDTCSNKKFEPPAEECDATAPASAANTLLCSKICKKLGTCGDGKKETGEECDDKNTIGGDGCSEKCKIEVIPKGCGNGKKVKPEQCDDNNNLNGDGCSYDCKKEPIPKNCGTDKGALQTAEGEECDDGNTKNGDGCSMTCKLEKSGGPGGAGAPPLTCDPACAADQECKANPAKPAKNICFGTCTPACDAWKTCAPITPAEPLKVACSFLKDKCDVEADCKDKTKTCDAAKHVCIIKKSCTSQAECNPDPIPSQFCDVDKKLCFSLLMAGNSCKSDNGDPQNEYCVSNICLTDFKCGCASEKDCAKNQLCEKNACIDKKAVGDECDVAKPKECISGNCGKNSKCLCNKSSECPDGTYCGSETSLCIPKLGDAGACKDKDQCLSGDCVIKAGEKSGTCTKPATPPAGSAPAPKIEPIALPNPFNTDDPAIVVGRVIEYVIGLVGSLALIMFMYGGAVWIFSGGNDKNIQKGKDTLIWASVGIAFVFTSYIIVKMVMKLLGANI